MRFLSLPLLAALPGLISAYDTPDAPVISHPTHRAQVKGYYPSYNADEGQTPNDINYSLYTDLIFFVAVPEANRTISFDSSLDPRQAEKLASQFVAKCKQNNVNPLLSFGGWTGSRYFSNLTTTDSDRKSFARELVTFSKRLGFIGIELDWEYPNRAGIGCNTFHPEDTVNFGLLTKELRSLWPEASLTAAIGITGLVGASGTAATTTETKMLVENLNYINLMAYDVYGAWAPTTGPIAPLSAACAPADFAQSVETGYEVVLKQGFKPEQIVLGIPGYAKRSELTSSTLSTTHANGKTSLYYQNHTSVTPPGGKFDDKPGVDICGAKTTWGGSFLTQELISNGWLSADEKSGLNGYTRYFDECSGMPFLTNGKYFISYDDFQSTSAKAKFAQSKKLAGIYFFDTQGTTDATVKNAAKIMQGQSSE